MRTSTTRRVAAIGLVIASVASGATLGCLGDAPDNISGDGGGADRGPPIDGAGDSPVDAATDGSPPMGEPVDLAAGFAHSCILFSGGDVWCWGRNEHGEVGVPTSANASCMVGSNKVGCLTIPTRVAAVPPLKQIRSAAIFTCGVDAQGGVWCWGANGTGQLGHVAGSEGDTTCNGAPCNSVPTKVPGVVASSVSVGASFACALTSNGGAVCWGDNSRGQLGTGGMSNSPLGPSPVVGMQGSVRDVFASRWEDHACATKTDGSLWCWGSADNAMLPSTDGGCCVGAPVKIAFPDSQPDDVRAVTLPFSAGCAARGPNGVVWCWGFNGYGAVGNFVGGTPAGSSAVPSKNGVDQAVELSGQGDGVCARRADGSVSCWGGSVWGSLGTGAGATTDGGATCNGQPCSAPVVVPGLKVKRIATGTGFSVALGIDGHLYGWGANDSGQTGHAPGTQGDLWCAASTSSKATCAVSPVMFQIP